MLSRFARFTKLSFAVGALALGAASAAACTVGITTTSNASPDAPINVPDGGSPDGGVPSVLGPADAGWADGIAAPFIHGSPLCNASDTTGCFPDYASSCDEADAGSGTGTPTSDGGASPPKRACRVHGSAPPQAACDTTSGQGGDGAPCTRSSDCAAGLECVGTGQCRQYCCDAKSCDTQGSSPFFCDIQTTAEVNGTKVPVCMPIARCRLLMNDCPAGQQCSIIATDGTTSCVDVGMAKLGDACDADHCAEGLVCLGAVGSRTCWQLCSSTNPTCPAYEKCHLGGPLVPDPSIGICDK